MKTKMMNYNGKEYTKKNNILRQQLKDNNIKWRLYHINDGGIKSITVCIAWNSEKKIRVRGIALCAQDDNRCNAVGNFYALKRVLKALKHRTNSDWVSRKEISEVITYPTMYLLVDGKSAYLPKLTEMEEKLMASSNEII